MACYDVALYRFWSFTTYYGYPYLAAVIDMVEAESPLLAALSLMNTHHIHYAAHVAVGLNGVVTRFESLKLHFEPAAWQESEANA